MHFQKPFCFSSCHFSEPESLSQHPKFLLPPSMPWFPVPRKGCLTPHPCSTPLLSHHSQSMHAHSTGVGCPCHEFQGSALLPHPPLPGAVNARFPSCHFSEMERLSQCPNFPPPLLMPWFPGPPPKRMADPSALQYTPSFTLWPGHSFPQYSMG